MEGEDVGEDDTVLSSRFIIIALAFFAPHNQTPPAQRTSFQRYTRLMHMLIPCWTVLLSVNWKAAPKTRLRKVSRALVGTFNHASS